jgi:hypothetical protein
MTEIEPYLVELIIKLSSMCMPITSSHGLGLANSLIAGTANKEKVIAWKKKTVLLFESTETRFLVKDIGRHS